MASVAEWKNRIKWVRAKSHSMTRCMVKVAVRTLRLPSASGIETMPDWDAWLLQCWDNSKKFYVPFSAKSAILDTFGDRFLSLQIFFCWKVRHHICLRSIWFLDVSFRLQMNAYCSIPLNGQLHHFPSFEFSYFVFFSFLSVVTRQNFHMNACAILHILQ